MLMDVGWNNDDIERNDDKHWTKRNEMDDNYNDDCVGDDAKTIYIYELYNDGVQKRKENFFFFYFVFLLLLFSSFSSSRAATRATRYMTTSSKTHRSA
jgi:hypothetical protein